MPASVPRRTGSGGRSGSVRFADSRSGTFALPSGSTGRGTAIIAGVLAVLAGVLWVLGAAAQQGLVDVGATRFFPHASQAAVIAMIGIGVLCVVVGLAAAGARPAACTWGAILMGLAAAYLLLDLEKLGPAGKLGLVLNVLALVFFAVARWQIGRHLADEETRTLHRVRRAAGSAPPKKAPSAPAEGPEKPAALPGPGPAKPGGAAQGA